MAVPEQTPYIEHTGNGSSKSFSLGFQCESKDHLIVLIDDIEPPIATWSLTEGNVVFTTAPAAGKKIIVQRNTPFGRAANYQSFNNSFRPQTVNIDFDRIWWKLQELGVADWLMKLYVDRLHQQQEQKINDLKGYVDDRDDELRAYLMDEIRKQGVALDQLEDYYNYLMQRLAQIAVDKGWDASFVVDESGKTQQQINNSIGAKWYERSAGYSLNDRVMLNNGNIVKSVIDGNINNPNTDLTGWVYDELYVTPEQHGAKGNGIDDDIIPIEKAHASLKPGQILVGLNTYAVSRTWLFNKKYVSLDVSGMLVPHGNFSDFLFRTDYDYTAGARNQERGDISGVVDIISLNIDCEFKSRGSYLYRIDCSTLDKVRVYRSYGTAIWSNRLRESSIIAPKVIGAKRRLRFDNPIFWSSSTAYTVGQRVRIGYSNYSNTTTYARYANVLGSDGNRYVSLSASNVGNDPVTSVGVWKRLPFIDYECLIAHTNKDPEQGFNSNSSTVANRFWRRVHQDEAVVEIVDEGNPNIDRQNQLVIDGADIRDWNNLCGVRIDNIKSNHPITHVKILNSHLHAVQWSVINNYANSGRAGEIVPEDIPEMMRVLEIGRTQNTYIFGNLRIPDSKDSIGVLIGDGNNKLTQSCNIGGVMSGSGDKQMGVYVGNSIIQGRSDLDLRYLLEGNDTIDLFDPTGFFTLQRDTPIQATIGKYRNGAPTAILAEIDPSYGQSYGVQVRKIGDTQPRVALEMSTTTASIRFGNGADSTDTRIYRDGAGVIRVDDANKFRIRGSWQYPFIMNNNRLWVDDSGLLRIKTTDPSSDTDGSVVGTQT